MKKLVSLIVILLFCLSARADYHYASHEGSDEYPYTSWETAAHLIQDAVDATDAHDTLYIGAGDWFEAVATDMYDSIAIIGMGIDSTFCHTDEYRITVMVTDYGCSVEGITFWHDDNWKCLRARVYADIKVKNCKFINTGIGLEVAGGPTTITDCIFDNCRRSIFLPGWLGDYYISNNLIVNGYEAEAMLLRVGSAIVENNIIINSDDNMDGMWGTRAIVRNNIVINGSRGIAVDFDSIYNNVIMNINYPSVSNWGILDSGYPNDDASIFNNSITGCIIGVFAYSPTEISYNNFWGNDTDIYNPGNHQIDSVGNIYSYPMYYSDEDFHLQAYSPLIDAGHPDILDVDGSRSDIGVYGGPYGYSYTYLDLAPQIPDSITVDVQGDNVVLNWRFNSEADFNRYQIFRDTVSGFEPSEFNMIAEPDSSYYEDDDIDPGVAYYYRLTSVDNQGNVSDFSDEVAVIPAGIVRGQDGSLLPEYSVIESAYPNPFNSDITIVYSASNLGPQPPEIKLQVFDIQGRVVRTLVDERKAMGTYRAVWDGTNDSGQPVSSGTYIAKVSQWGMDAGDFPVKITLIK